MSDTIEIPLPPEVALAMWRELRAIQAWAHLRCNIHFQPGDDGTIGFTIHDSAGCEVARGTNYQAFATAFASSIETMLAIVRTQSNRELADLGAALQDGGLTLTDSLVDSTSEGTRAVWGFRWPCGCHGEGFPSKMAAITAALKVHADTHRDMGS